LESSTAKFLSLAAALAMTAMALCWPVFAQAGGPVSIAQLRTTAAAGEKKVVV
jgi:hypothetical protein